MGYRWLLDPLIVSNPNLHPLPRPLRPRGSPDLPAIVAAFRSHSRDRIFNRVKHLAADPTLMNGLKPTSKAGLPFARTGARDP